MILLAITEAINPATSDSAEAGMLVAEVMWVPGSGWLRGLAGDGVADELQKGPTLNLYGTWLCFFLSAMFCINIRSDFGFGSMFKHLSTWVLVMVQECSSDASLLGLAADLF